MVDGIMGMRGMRTKSIGMSIRGVQRMIYLSSENEVPISYDKMIYLSSENEVPIPYNKMTNLNTNT